MSDSGTAPARTAGATDAQPRHPLGSMTLPAVPGLTIQVAPPAVRLVLRGDKTVAAAAGMAFGTSLPLQPNRAERRRPGGPAALWLGPDEWLLIAPGTSTATLQDALVPALAGRPHSLVDVSSRQIGLVLEGRLAHCALSAGCPLDLRLTSFPVGMVTRTVFLKTEIVLWRQDDQRFHVEVWRSFAKYLVGHLAEIAADTPER